MLFGGGLLAIFGSEMLHYEGAGPLAVVFAAFTSSYFWCKQGWELEDNPVATAFEIFWMIFEPILFGITGASVKFNELDPHVVTYGLISLATSGILRVLVTIFIAFGDKLNWKEKVKRINKKNLNNYITKIFQGIYGHRCQCESYGSGCSRSSRAQAFIRRRSRQGVRRDCVNGVHPEYCSDRSTGCHLNFNNWHETAVEDHATTYRRR